MKLSKGLIVPAILVCVIIFLLLKDGCNARKLDKSKDLISLEKAKGDTLKIDPDGTASKQTFADADVRMLLTELEKVNVQLAKSLKAGSKVAIVTKTQIRIDTVVVNQVDTIGSDTRTAIIKTKDYTINIRSTPDSTGHKLSAVDTVSYSINKDYRLMAKHSWKDLKVVELESFYVKPKVKRTGWKFWLGVAIGAGGVVALTR